ANVLKRTANPATLFTYLTRLLKTKSNVVRWRVVHALGAIPKYQAVQTLLRILDEDADEWVRFGAARSLVEVAASGSSTVRRRVFNALGRRVPAIIQQPRIRKEIESV